VLRIIIAGGRDFSNSKLIEDTLQKVTTGMRAGEVQIISGMARGADQLGYDIARLYGANIAQFPAQWDTYGKSAGYKRNTLMADNADMLLAFWDGSSKGTKHMIDIAKSKDLVVHIIKY
jgi:hypothetical protein